MFDHVFEKVNRVVAFHINLFGYQIEISNTIVVSWGVMAAIILLAVLFTRRLSVDKPDKLQCLVELGVEAAIKLCHTSIGHHGMAFVSYIGTLTLYLVFANIVAVFNFIPGLAIYPPTKDINVTGALALMSIIVVLYASFKYKGFVGWLKSLAQPMAVMIPFKLLEYITKPLSLCLRLFGNIVAGFIIMELILGFVPVISLPLSVYFDWFDGILQAYIFIYLTTIYIGEAVEA